MQSESSPRQSLLHLMQRLYGLRHNYNLLLSIPLLIFMLWAGASEWIQYQQTRNQMQQLAERAGAAYARIIEDRLNNQFRTMHFASTLLDTPSLMQPINTANLALFKRLLHQYPEFYALNIYAPDGTTRLWSNTPEADFQQITPADQFTPLSNPNDLFGQDNVPRIGEPKVLSLRYRVQNAEGATVFFLSTPFNLSTLLQYPAGNLPWRFTVIDTRDQSILGTWSRQKLTIPDHAERLANRHPTGVLASHQTMPNSPLEICTAISEQAVNHAYWQGARARIALYAGLLFLLILSAWELNRLMRERKRAEAQLLRLAQFNALLAEVNQVIDRSSTESALLHTICELAVQQGGLRLAIIARPDEQGWFKPLAISGPAAGYATGLKLSNRADSPYGQGTGGVVWRSGEAFYSNDFVNHANLSPWAERAAEFGIQASATLPIFKHGQIWAIFAVYHAQKQIFDTPLRATLKQLAQDIGYGLQQLDIQQREKNASAMQLALLNNTLAGIALVRDRIFTQVNTRLVTLLGYDTANELVGQPMQIMYFDHDEFEKIGRIYPSLIAHSKISMLDIRLKKRDGSLIYVDLSGSLIEGTQYQSTVWTFQDSTQRHQFQHELKQSAAFQHTLFEKNAAAMLILDAEQRITEINPALCTLTGFQPAQLYGQPIQILHCKAAPALLNPETSDTLTPSVNPDVSCQLQHHDGRIRFVERLTAPLTLRNGAPGELWSMIDITPLHEAQQDITHQAMHDALTNLPNRRALELWIPQAIARARRKHTVVAVGMLDLDDFKPVNDTFGHAAGDQLLRALATRLKSRLREADFMARLGGDEFVVVLEDIDDTRTEAQLTIALNRLHQAVEEPFEVAAGQWAKIGMSMGVALYPQDGDEGDGLIRIADATLYQLKAHKTTRASWWQIAQATPSPAAKPKLSNDAYAPDNQDLLRQHAPFLEHIAAEFMDVFYRDFERNSDINAIFSTLTPEAKATLISEQAEHLLFVLGAQTTREQIQQKAHHVGKVHALVGVGSVHLMQSLSLYRKLLTDFLNQSTLAARDRYRLLMIAEARLEDDILAQAQAGGETIQNYFALLTAPMPPQACFWIEAIASEIHPLSTCPGIQAVLLFRPNSEGTMTIESSAGNQAQAMAAVLNRPGQEALLNAKAARGQGLSAEAWRTGSIQTTAHMQTDNRYAHWLPHIQALRIQSVMAVPIINSAGASIAVLTLYGAYPRQFESTWIQQFARNLQQRLNQIWLLCTIPNLVIDQQLAQHYRQVLFADGLRVYVQPIIDLHSGSLVKVEVLARLQLPSGELLSPANFLPLLGELELNQLFFRVLDTALHQLNAWNAQGLVLDISVNLAPQTLLDPQCPAWIEAALQKHGIAPARLTLKILESQAIDKMEQDAAISAIVALGVPLAMDDLGAGYSSLQRLATLPFETIKVDQSLLSQLHNNPIQTLSLIAAIIQMGRDFEQTVVVEGLENNGALEVARILGARYGQGYGIARPMPIDQLFAWHQTRPEVQAPEQLQTAIGALAFHWWFMHNGHRAHPHSAAACPLSAFLAQDASATDEVRQWHAEVHSATDSRMASRKLIAWLAQRAHEAKPPALD